MVRRALSLVGAALLVAGCAGETTDRQGADLARGRTLFSQQCGQCHALDAAGTQGQIGPNLDHAFGFARGDGFRESTFFEVTLQQMRIPAPPMPDYDSGPQKLSEDDLVNVAAFVAQCAGAGEGGELPPACAAGAQEEQPQSGKAIFTQTCGSCHVLADAGTSGTIGPNLDEASLTLEGTIEQVRNGGGGMPPFEDRLSEEQIEAVSEYVVEAAGK